MERQRKQGGESDNSRRVAQAKFTSKSRESEQEQQLANSPAMAAQRMKLQSLFGGAVQRQGMEDEPLQGKFDAVQRVEEEEPLQGRFDTAQRVEEEEPLQGKFETAQRVEEEEPLQGRFEPVQRVEVEEPLLGKFEAASTSQLKEEAVRSNNTGLPDNLKSGIESLSGMSMDNVRVHYNSSQPAQLNALAYAQGTDIHVAPGQEKHLPHEAWHVVQQAQGRVQPTKQMKEGVPVNDDKSLENEADVMGAKAAMSSDSDMLPIDVPVSSEHNGTTQCALPKDGYPETKGYYTARNDSKKVQYNGGRPVKFSKNFKYSMLKNEWNAYQAEDEHWYVNAGSHIVVDDAIQIDHQYPWDSIEADLLAWPSGLNSDTKDNYRNNGLLTSKDKPSLYAARMYYHDVPNLKPLTGSENASKGASDAKDQRKIDEYVQYALNQSVGKFHVMAGKCQEMVRDWGHDSSALDDAGATLKEVDSSVETAREYFESY